MNITGIVAEYNPFHNGHAYHLQQAREATKADAVIVAMSGNYVQRGEPALLDKWHRAEMALQNGADLVLEIPTLFSCLSAEQYAQFAVRLLYDSGIVSHLCFGCENKAEEIVSAACLLQQEPAELQADIQKLLACGLSLASARGEALKMAFPQFPPSLWEMPNNILALEYCRAIEKLGSSIQIAGIPRLSASYHSSKIESSIASATAIRKSILTSSFPLVKTAMPSAAFSILLEAIQQEEAPVLFSSFSPFLQYCLRTLPPEQAECIESMGEGLSNRIRKAAEASRNMEDLLDTVKTKRYSYARIRRGLLHMILDIRQQDVAYWKNRSVPYIRVLGFRKQSEWLLGELQKNAAAPVLYHPGKTTLPPDSQAVLDKEVVAGRLYNWAKPAGAAGSFSSEYTTSIVVTQ